MPSLNPSEFDVYAADYDTALNRGLSVSGEGKEYFARGRLRHVAGRLAAFGESPRRILDFGCGTGTATPFLLECWPEAQLILGTDISPASLEVARRAHGSERIRFELMNEFRPDGSFDLVYCNGVFHHIPPDQRQEVLRYIRDCLRPGGRFALWENNPWNPGTRYVMSRIPFDRDAITLAPPAARRMLAEGGLEVVRSDYLFIFPRFLKWLRPLERLVVGVPIGAQYLTLAQRSR